MKYEDVAKDMIATVRKFVPADPVNARLLEALRKAEKKLVELEHSVGGGDGEIVMESEILSARAAIAAAEARQAEPVRLTDKQINGADGWLQEAPFWRVVKFARAIEAAVLRKNGFKVEG